MKLLSDKWPNAQYLAYFQSHTNTYAPVEQLRRQYSEALAHPEVKGLVIATRPDCLSEEVLDLLAEFNEKTFMWVELGLQTTHEDTAELINRCYPLSTYDTAIEELHKRGIRVVTHLIFGLPGETHQQMLDSVRYICRDLSDGKSGEPEHIFGIKIHMLNLVRGSRMEKLYPDYVSFDSIEEYVDLVIQALEIIPPDITIHRMSGDAPRPTLISPEWSYKKRTILNSIHQQLRARKTWQGAKL
jgi:radical SAM protein (TIGR01212 family)